VDKVIAKGKRIAAHLMEAADTDVEFTDGAFKVVGTDKQIPFAQVALTAYVPHNYPHDKLEPGLNENAFYDPTNFTFPAGSHICEVEIDRYRRHADCGLHRSGRLRHHRQSDDRRGQVHVVWRKASGRRWRAAFAGHRATRHWSLLDYCVPLG
jgi:hypothetical protein